MHPTRLPWRTAAKATLLVLAGTFAWPLQAAAEQLAIGSKRFTESYILGEVITQAARQGGATAEHRQGLGNTAVVVEALKTGSIDVYPEYLGTVEREILKLPTGSSREAIDQKLREMGLALGVPLGFSNGYALAASAEVARKHGLKTLGDLRSAPDLRIAISQEFLGREDGWPGLARRYQLPQRPTSIDHGLSYQALASQRIDLTDIYTTDARIADLGLVTLQDDANYFPRYDAVLLYRADLPTRAPQAWRRIAALEGRIDVTRMIAMNAQAELHGQAFPAIAADFLAGKATPAAAPTSASSAASTAEPQARPSLSTAIFGGDFWRLTRDHLWLVAVSVGIAVLIGIPLGTLAAARAWLGQGILGFVGLLQTVPSLALLAALIPLLGRIGTVPAIVALSLYALLPIVRNTAVGLMQVPKGTQQAAVALGMTPAQSWRLVLLPLALPVIIAGVKTATVMTVGTATIAAFIGAGGYGERIAQGLALNDGTTLLAGAIPSAGLAVLIQVVFEVVERMFRQPGAAAS
ncbi:glycine betaine ABC transporter substrate-binding protein [Acidovorax sp. A1169]|uniref:glycine betaine ABC transporter substrate-binding protein n=1 Tax=Acidovorax sp. A1169 TaxID=3059524 RepID=UPI002737E14A|nr:glycine betaine ABC transporter substrate-binding protein [Acidovorax sp. A1169]MDP4078391.1 glycine betaine ABC transporter substrate-binding protein [Acidovorax sp. A1169]